MEPPPRLPRAALFRWLIRQDPPITKADIHAIINASGFSAFEKLDAHVLVDEAVEFERDHPMLLTLAPALLGAGAGQVEVDAAFIAALEFVL